MAASDPPARKGLAVVYPPGILPGYPDSCACVGRGGFDNHSTKIRHNILFPLSRRPPICGALKKIFPDPANRRAAFLSFLHFLHRDDSPCRANPRRIGIISVFTPRSSRLPFFGNFFLHNGYKRVIIYATITYWKKVMETINGKDN